MRARFESDANGSRRAEADRFEAGATASDGQALRCNHNRDTVLTKKRHHYLPQVYLNEFCRDGGLWVHDFKVPKTFGTQPINVGVVGYYYSIVTQDGGRDNAIEDMLAGVESSVAAILVALRNRTLPSAEDRSKLALFLGLLVGRVPAFLEIIRNFYRSMLERFVAAGAIVPGAFAHERRLYAERHGCTVAEVQDDGLLAWLREHGVGEAVHKNQLLSHFLDVAQMAARAFQSMQWEFCFAPSKTSFVTTDRPLFLLPLEKRLPSIWGIGLFDSAALRVVPLSQHCCLFLRVAHDRQSRMIMKEATARDVREVNRQIAYKAERFLVARDEALVDNLANTVRAARDARANGQTKG